MSKSKREAWVVEGRLRNGPWRILTAGETYDVQRGKLVLLGATYGHAIKVRLARYIPAPSQRKQRKKRGSR